MNMSSLDMREISDVGFWAGAEILDKGRIKKMIQDLGPGIISADLRRWKARGRAGDYLRGFETVESPGLGRGLSPWI